MKRFQTAAMLAAAAIAVAGCKQQNQGGLSQSSSRDEGAAKSETRTIDQSAKEAKDQISQQAKAQKERIEAEATAAKAQIKAEQADIKARTNNAQQAVDANTQKIRDAAGAVTSQSQSQSGGQSSTSSTTDQSLTDLVKRAVGVSPDFTSATGNDVQVTVSNGTVTLSGTVASEQDKTTKEKQAKAVPGVKEVQNQLQVKAQ
jgi:osmotically-inducible protein OsmY